jgi:hypothetical protein
MNARENGPADNCAKQRTNVVCLKEFILYAHKECLKINDILIMSILEMLGYL